MAEATRVAVGTAEGIRKVRVHPGRIGVVGPAALLLLLLAACTPGDGGGDDAGADLAGVHLSEHEVVYSRWSGEEDADLWLVKADGTDPVQLTDEPGLEFMAAWSPDGDRLVYAASAAQDSPSDLFVVDLGDGERQQVTSTPDRCESAPSWTQDGEGLVYVSGDCEVEAEGIFATDLDGGDGARAGHGRRLARRRAGRTAALHGPGPRRAVARPAAVGERAGRHAAAGRDPAGVRVCLGGDLVARRQPDRLRRRGR